MRAGRTYYAFGLTIRSEVPLPDLLSIPERPPDVEICRGAVDLKLDDPINFGSDFVLGRNELRGPMKPTGRYAVREGRFIVLDDVDGLSVETLQHYVTGILTGVLLHQRGVLALHASGLATPWGAVLFCGPSGAGKSTTAALLRERGFPLLADDVCAVRSDAGGRVLAVPGIPAQRLWSDTLEKVAGSREGRPLEIFDSDKYVVPAGDAFGLEPVAIDTVYILSTVPGPLAFQRLSGVDKVLRIRQQAYFPRYLEVGGSNERYVEEATALARSARVAVLQHAREWPRSRELTDAILADLAENGPAGPRG